MLTMYFQYASCVTPSNNASIWTSRYLMLDSSLCDILAWMSAIAF
jgi:hypothetical protein